MNTEVTPSYAHTISLIPKSGTCYDFIGDNNRTRKSIWLVPHVIKYREESEVITWRCNWGNVCESNCLYAMNKNRNNPPVVLPPLDQRL
jgi:hypothetical protein